MTGLARLGLLVALTMVAFAANSILNRAAVDGADMDPVAFAAIRVVSGALALLIIAGAGGRLQGGTILSPARLLGAFSLAVYMLGFSLAYRTLDAGIGALILFGGVQITMFAGAALSGAPIPATRLVGAGIAIGGLAVLLWPSGEVQIDLAGAGLMAAAAVGWGVYSLRGAQEPDALRATALNFALLAPVFLALGLISWPASVPAGAIGLAVLSGVVTSGAGYALWYAVLPRLKATVAGVAQLSVPVIAVVAGALLLAEPVGARVLVSAALVIGGIALSLRPARRP